MQLTYRGIRYENQPKVLETLEETLPGKYRGVPISVKRVTQPQPQSKHAVVFMKYRGVDFVPASA